MIALAHGLTTLGITVSLCCPSQSPLTETPIRGSVNLVPIEKCGSVDIKASRKLATLLAHEGVDIIHAHNSRTALASTLAVGLAGKGRTIATQHFIEPGRLLEGTLRRTVKNFAHRCMNRRIDHFIAISLAVADAMISRGDTKPEKVTIVPNGIPSPNAAELQSRARVRAQLRIQPDIPLIVCAARLEPEKDIESLIAAMGLLKRQCTSARCIVLGEGSQRAALQESVRRIGVEETVALLGFHNDAMSLINAADLVVLPSRAEPFGLVLLEAMALEKPVIATRAGGPMEIVVHGETGYLVPPSEPEFLADAIRTLVMDREACTRMGMNGRRRFLERFTSEAMSRRVLSVYENVLGLPSRRTLRRPNAPFAPHS